MNSKIKSSALAQELEELFDIRNSKSRDEKRILQESNEALRDIRLLTLMFLDGIPDITIPVTDSESIKWDSKVQKLLYINRDSSHILEACPRLTMIKMRPHLSELVKKAKDFYKD